MDIPQSVTRVFTKYDTIPGQIRIPSPNSVKPIFYGDDQTTPVGYIVEALILRRVAMNRGLEGVVFAHYVPEDVFAREYAGGLVGEATFVGCSIQGAHA